MTYTTIEVQNLIKRFNRECTGQPWFEEDEEWLNKNVPENPEKSSFRKGIDDYDWTNETLNG
jgi:hypothetical protein